MNASDRTAIFETLPVHQAVYKQIIPAIVSQMIALIYNLADTYFVGILNDPHQTAAITIAAPSFVMLTAISNLFGVGLVVGAFECAIEYQGGRGSIKDTAMNYIKGFMAVSLFTVVPVNLYSLCVSLQGTFGSAITGITNAESIGLTAQQVLMSA